MSTNYPHTIREVNVLREATAVLPTCMAMAQTPAEQARLDLLFTRDEQVTLCEASAILAKAIRTVQYLTGPTIVRDYLRLKLAGLVDVEVFGVVLLDAQHGVIDDVVLFRGTIAQTSVYPREVVKIALLTGAKSCLLYHNHPSGSLTFSRADEKLTHTLKTALGTVDVDVLDHILVSINGTVSMAEKGLI